MLLVRQEKKMVLSFLLHIIYIPTPWLPSRNLMHTMAFQTCPHCFPQPDPVTLQSQFATP